MRISSKLGALVLGLSLVLGSLAAKAETSPEDLQTVDVPKSYFRLDPGQVVRLELAGGWRYVENLFVQAQATSTDYVDGEFEVWVNGKAKGTIHVPGRDPNFVVTVRETTGSIELRHVGGGSVNILNIKANQSVRGADSTQYTDSCDYQQDIGEPVELPSNNVAAFLANRARELVDQLKDDVDPETEYVPYLLPIRTVAGKTWSIADSDSDLAPTTHDALVALDKQIIYADPLLSKLLQRSNSVTYDRTVRLLEIRRKIEDRLHLSSTTP